VIGLDPLNVAFGRHHEGVEGHCIDGAHVSPGDLEESVDGGVCEEARSGADLIKAMGDIIPGPVRREVEELDMSGQTHGQGIEGIAQEGLEERRLTAQDHWERKSAVHVEVGEEPEDGEDLGGHILCLVDEQYVAEPVAEGVLDGVLQASDQGRVLSCGGKSEGHGELPTQVSAPEACDLDVGHLIAGLGERVAQRAKENRLPGAGGTGDGAGVPLLYCLHDSGKAGIELGEREAFFDGELPGEGNGIETEVGSEIDSTVCHDKILFYAP